MEEDNSNFDVEGIMAEKWDPEQGRTLFLVSWTGFEEKDYTWEPVEHFHSEETILDWEKHKAKTPASARFDWRAWEKKYRHEDGQDSVPRTDNHGLALLDVSRSDASGSLIAIPPSGLHPRTIEEHLSSTESLADELQEKASFIRDNAETKLGHFDREISSNSSPQLLPSPKFSHPAQVTVPSEIAKVTGSLKLSEPVSESCLSINLQGQPSLNPDNEKDRQAQPFAILVDLPSTQTTAVSEEQTKCRGFVAPKKVKSTAGKPSSEILVPSSETYQVEPGYISLATSTEPHKKDHSSQPLADGNISRRQHGNSEPPKQDALSMIKPMGLAQLAGRSTANDDVDINPLPERFQISKGNSAHYIVSIEQIGLQVEEGVDFLGLSSEFIKHLRDENIEKLVVNAFMGFDYLDRVIVQDHGMPLEKGTIEGGGALTDDFVARVSELQGVAVIQESTFTMMLAPSHAQRFNGIFNLGQGTRCKMQYIVYPGLDIPKIDINTKKLLENAEFPGRFVLETSNWDFSSTFAHMGDSRLNFIVIPSLRDSKYNYDIVNALHSCSLKRGDREVYSKKSIALLRIQDITSKTMKIYGDSHGFIFLIHASLLRSLHIIPQLASLRSKRHDNMFFVYGPNADFGRSSMSWNIYPIFPSGGVFLITVELVVQQASSIKFILDILDDNGRRKDWSFAIDKHFLQKVNGFKDATKSLWGEEADLRNAEVVYLLETLKSKIDNSPDSFHLLEFANSSSTNQSESCVDAFVKLQSEVMRDYRFFVVVCGSGLSNKGDLERQYTNLDIFEMVDFIAFIKSH